MKTETHRRVSHKLVIAFLCLFSLIFVTSCNKNVVYSKYQTFNENEWYIKDKAIFDIDITDTVSLNNISLMVRHADSYPFKNLYLFVSTTYPDGKVIDDTMEIVLASQKGEWYGSGAGDIFDLKMPIKKNVRFVLPGKYQFSFEQGMRIDPLPLLMDLGFEIEKIDNK